MAQTALTVSGITAADKVYDGATVATLNTASAALVGTIAVGDDVQLVLGGATGAFATATVGAGKTVTVAGLTLAGAQAANYTLTAPTATAAITAKSLTVAGATASDKVYDGSLTASVSFAGATLTGVVGADVVTLDSSAAAAQFATKAVGAAKPITVSGLALAGADAGNYALQVPSISAAITAKPLTVSGVTTGKVYDGTTTAALNIGSATLNGLVGGDVVTISTSGVSAAFADKNVGAAKAVTVSGLSLAGADGGNYSLTQPAVTGDITVRSLAVSGLSITSKVYDGTATAPLDTSAATLNAVAGDAVTLVTGGATALYADKAVGSAKGVTIAGLSIGGADATNYSFSQPSLTGAITARALTVAGVTASDKVYDGGTAATVDFSAATLGNVVAGDVVALATGSASVAFADKAVGAAKPITIAGLAVSGADATNYTVAAPAASANITAKSLTVAGITASKVYDGTTAATLNVAAAVLVGVVGGDAVTLDGGGATATFADKAVGLAKPVTVGGLALGGGAAGNYTLVQPSLTADITAKSVTVSGVVAANKVYDATRAAAVDFAAAVLVGAVGGDVVTLATGAAAGTFDTKQVGTAKPVAISGLTLAGADAGNYDLTQPGTSANIAAKNLTVSGVSAANKVYDGAVAAVANFGAATLNGIETGDVVTLVTATVAATFADKAVGATKAVSVSGLTLAGADGTNYTVTQPATTADISAKPVTITGVTVATKIYDTTPAATLNLGSAALSGVVTGDVVALQSAGVTSVFADQNAGAAKPVTIAGFTIDGADAANYSLSQPAATGTITAATLTVTGITATPRPYDGTTAVALDTSSAALVGILAGDTVTLNTASATGRLSDSGAAASKSVSISGLSLGGSSAANYTLSAPTTSVEIAKARATIAFSNLRQSYDGKVKTVAATSTPVGLSLTFDYNSEKPVDAGSYMVTASINDPNYVGLESGTLTITKADQTISFPSSGVPEIGKPFALSATASSGLAVTFSVASGNATLAGGSLTVNDIGTVVVKASQDGDKNYNSVSATASFTTGKLAQTIAFAAIGGHGTADAPFTLSATASSGLPVTLALSSGPAVLSGNTVTLTGAPGVVSITASQSGNATYSAAVEVTQSFTVTATAPIIYFGAIVSPVAQLASRDGDTVNAATAAPTADSFAVELSADLRAGTMLGYIASLNEAFVVAFEPAANGDFAVTTMTTAAGKAGVNRVFRGKVAGGTITGAIDGTGISYSAAVQAPTGVTSALVGYYKANALGAANAATYAIVGANGRAFVLAVTPQTVEAQSTPITAAGKFTLTSATNTTIIGEIDAANSAVVATVAATGQPTFTCSGLRANALRTDRLVNLSSRAVVGSGSRTLISGFVVSGAAPKPVLIRAIGPGLSAFGVRGMAGNPQLTVYSGTTVVAQNRGWSNAANAAEIVATAARVGAFALTNGSTDSVVLVTLPPGSYTAQVSNPGSDAVALAEIYDASTSAGTDAQRLVNVSTRGMTGTGEDLLIGGFVVSGNVPKTVLIRGIGPALGAFGVDGSVADPVVSIFQGTTLVAQNDNWDADASTARQVSDAAAKAGAFTLAAGSRDAAVVLTLAPGSYTAQVAGRAATTGVALVEIYEVQ